jgi:putative ubiquitin-RnfH superfamily antitoxin RatB of RatAB toxin-antitoxin module
MAEKKHIEVIQFSGSNTFQWVSVPMSQALDTVQDVLGVLGWNIDVQSSRLSIWGRPARLEQKISHGARIEITKPLQRSPNEMRLIRKRLGMLRGDAT